MAGKRTGAFVGGVIVGAVAGTIAGMLAAPQSGRETRTILKRSMAELPDLAEDLTTILQSQADRLSESALRNWEETLVRLQVAIAAGIEASHQAQEAENAETVSVAAYSYESSEVPGNPTATQRS
jgi:gas vesicle protein